MSEGLKKLKVGDFNNMKQEKQADNSVIITLSNRHYSEVYRFRVKNLYKDDEQELDLETGEPLP